MLRARLKKSRDLLKETIIEIREDRWFLAYSCFGFIYAFTFSIFLLGNFVGALSVFQRGAILAVMSLSLLGNALILLKLIYLDYTGEKVLSSSGFVLLLAGSIVLGALAIHDLSQYAPSHE